MRVICSGVEVRGILEDSAAFADGIHEGEVTFEESAAATGHNQQRDSKPASGVAMPGLGP